MAVSVWRIHYVHARSWAHVLTGIAVDCKVLKQGTTVTKCVGDPQLQSLFLETLGPPAGQYVESSPEIPAPGFIGRPVAPTLDKHPG